MITGTIFDIERFSIRDGPGIRTTIFFKGCPLHCWWCHNPESQSVQPELMFRAHYCIRCGACVAQCPENAISLASDPATTDASRCTVCGDCVAACQTEARELIGRTMTVPQAIAEIEKDIIFYDESGGGVTFSGGEPLMQPEFLLALLRVCKEREIRTAIDTCGLATWEILQPIADSVDLILYDLKLMDDECHRKYAGVSNQLILGNLRRLIEAGHRVNVRVPIIPGINDDGDNIARLGKFVASLAEPPPVSLLPYHKAGLNKYHRLNKTYALLEIEPPPGERVAEIVAALQKFGLEVHVGG